MSRAFSKTKFDTHSDIFCILDQVRFNLLVTRTQLTRNQPVLRDRLFSGDTVMAAFELPKEPVQVEFNQQPVRRGSSGGTVVGLLLLLVLVSGGAFAWASLNGDEESQRKDGVLLYNVVKDDILVTVTEDGNVESAMNVDVKSSVSGGSTILWIVEDGTTVEAGDEIVRLDKSNIEDQLNSQKMNFEKANAARIQARGDHGAAELAVNEYQEGTFIEEQKKAEADIRIAQENLRSAENFLVFTKKMVRKGFATSLQREADQFAVERAKLELEAAETRKKVLVEFTKQKTLKDLEAKREAAAAQARANQAAFDLEKVRLERLQKQLNSCVIHAPQNGMVVYANNPGRRYGGNQDVQIEEGASVRERQTIIRLPDLSQMQVKVTVHESKIDQLRRGMPARIVIQDVDYKGHVISVANQPEQTSWFSANVKEYATTVAIEGESKTLRPGMTAHVEILIADLKDVVTVPVSSIVEQRGSYFCWVKNTDGYRKQPLELGRTNDKMVEVLGGVKENDKVLRNPKAVIDEAAREILLEDSGRDRSQFGDGDLSDGTQDTQLRAEQTSDGQRRGISGGGSELPESGKAYIAEYDKDGDDKVAQSELDEQSQRSAQFWFSHVDADGDGALNEAETNAMLESRRRFTSAGQFGGAPDGASAGGRTDDVAQPADRERPDRRSSSAHGGLDMMQFDTDGDGKVSKDEAPERMRPFFDRMDTNGDGGITTEEIEEVRRTRGGQGGSPAGLNGRR